MFNGNVLLVDDEKEFIDTISKRLNKRNFSTITSNSGMDALEKLKEDSSDVEVVILDVKMPGLDGIETLAEIKRKHPLKEVIMLTGHATVSSAIDGMKKEGIALLKQSLEIGKAAGFPDVGQIEKVLGELGELGE